MAEKHERDLTVHSFTFPELKPDPEIPLDSKIRELIRKFSATNPRIIIEGPVGSGKTVHLAQFSQAKNTFCFSYFLTDDYWVLRQTAFLTSLCNQMCEFLGIPQINYDNNIESLRIDIEKLKTIFDGLSQKVIEIIKKDGLICYFVIDGLEKSIQGNPGERIIDLFPLPVHPKGLFFLGSVLSSNTTSFHFDYITDEPHYFSFLETKSYLSELNLTDDQLKLIQNQSSGIPGYLMLLRKTYQQNPQILPKLINEPKKIETLIDNIVKDTLLEISDNQKLILALIAYSLTPLSISTISTISGIDTNEVRRLITNIGILKRVNEDCYCIFPDLYRSFAQKKLANYKTNVYTKLSRYYETAQDTKLSFLLLPEYYRLSNNYEALEALITTDYIVKVTEDNKDLSIAIRDLSNAIDLASDNSDIDILRFSLANSQLRSLSTQIIGMSEVRALSAMKKFDEALELAYSAGLLTTKIRLLTQIYISMEKEGITVPRQAIYEISRMVEELNVKELHPESILRIASDIFPLLPDVAISLIDKAHLLEKEQTNIELFALITSVNSDNPDCESLMDNFSNDELKDFALIHSPWMSKLSPAEIVRKSDQTKNTKAKEYLLRNWCLQNKNDPNIHIVLSQALDILVNDPSYKIPLYHLRQFSDALTKCKKETRELLINRFDIPNFTSLRSPIQERIHLELNLVEALYDIDEPSAFTRFKNSYETFNNEIIDTDISCYCLVRMLITLSKIDPKDNLKVKKVIDDKLQDDFIMVIDSAADQLDIIRATLKSLALVNPQLSITFCSMLNTVNRRDLSLQEVIMEYIQQDTIPVSADFLTQSIQSIVDKKIFEHTILKIIGLLVKTKKINDPTFSTLCSQWVHQINDPVTKARCYALLLKQEKVSTDIEIRNELFTKLINAWERIDVIWMRVEAAYDLATIIADVHKDLSEDLFSKAKAISSVSGLANQTIGVMYFDTIKTACKVSSNLDLSKSDSKSLFVDLLNSVEAIPSNLLRILLLAEIALGRLRAGDKKTFEAIIQEKILTNIQSFDLSDINCYVISNIALVLFEFSPEEAKHWVDKLPYNLQNTTWGKTAIKVISQSNIFDLIDDNPPNVSLDLAIVNKVIRILEFVERDSEIDRITNSLCYAISNSKCRLNEQQKLDVLARLENLLGKKFPDTKNISHEGYKLLTLGYIERAKRKSAIKSKALIARNHSRIVKDARNIKNIADKVFVLSQLGSEFREIENELGASLVKESFSLVSNIPNVKDRIDRLETILEGFGKLHDNAKVNEVLRMGRELAHEFEGIERDQVLASIIQTAHQINKDLASQVTEKIEDYRISYSLSVNLRAQELAKAPNKIDLLTFENPFNDEILKTAASTMSRYLTSGRNVSYSNKLIFKWLASTKYYGFEPNFEVVSWSVEALLRQVTDTERSELAYKIISCFLDNCLLLQKIGNQLIPLTSIPLNLRENFQGLSTTKRYFKVGDRQKAVDFVTNWLKANARQNVAICDPYFNPKQLWILQSIPNDIDVKIITTGNGFGLQSKNKEKVDIPPDRDLIRQAKKRIQTDLLTAWDEISNQVPPHTLFILHNTVFDTDEKDEFHDRYIITDQAGLSIGTSLNGMGNKEFFITLLSIDDVKYVFNTYIEPKLRIQEYFSKIIYFELGD